MANYYRKFIKGFSNIAAPLNALRGKNIKFTWTSECQKSFEALKEALTTAPVLSYPDPSKNFILSCDASDNAVGYTLGQRTMDNKETVIAYGGKSLTKEEKKYSTSEKELLAVVRGVQAYRPYLAGNKFTIYTDHKALIWLKTAKHTGRLERWALKLQEYNFDIVHKPGKKNCVADAISRIPCSPSTDPTVSSVSIQHQTSASPLHQIQPILQENDIQEGVQIMFSNEEPETFIMAIEDDEIHQILQDKDTLFRLQSECPDYADIIKYLTDGSLPEDRKFRDKVVSESQHYCIMDQLLYHLFQRRCKRQPEEFKFIYQLALPRELRKNALFAYHDSLAGGGHLGIDKVRFTMMQKYYWPRMNQDIIDYVRSCDRCQRAKRDFRPSKPPMTLMPRREKFESWQIDILGPLKKSPEGYEYILLCIDSFTRWPEAFPLKSQDAREVAEVLFRDIFARYGSPLILMSDRGRNFMSKLINALCEIFEITQYHTSSYHPNTNGLVERQNSTIAQSLRAYCANDQDKWPKLLPGIMMSFRKSPHLWSTEYSPYELMFGHEMRLPFDATLQPRDNLQRDAKQYMKDLLARLKVST